MPLCSRILETSFSRTEDGRDSRIPNKRSVTIAVMTAAMRNTHLLFQSACFF